jgi:hypothetical protein
MSDHLELEAISAHLDAELAAEDEAAVREHLSACGECRAALEELKALDRLARAAPEPAPREAGADLATRVRARLLAERSGTRTLQGTWLAAAAALAAVLVLPWMLLDRTRKAEPVREPPPAIADRAPQPAVTDRPPATSAPGFAPAPAQERKKAPAPVPPPAAFEATPAEARRRETARGEGADQVAAAEATEPQTAPAAAPPPPPPPPPASAPVEALAKDKVARTDAARKSGAFAAGASQSAEGGRRNAPGDDEFAALSSREVSTAGEARRWRDDWREYVRRYPAGAHVSRARLALVAAGAMAYRLERRPADLDRLRRDVEQVRRVGDSTEAAAAQRILEDSQREAETERSP